MDKKDDKDKLKVIQAFLDNGERGNAYAETYLNFKKDCISRLERVAGYKHSNYIEDALYQGIQNFLDKIQDKQGDFDFQKFNGKYIAKFCEGVFRNLRRLKSEEAVDLSEPTAIFKHPTADLQDEVDSIFNIELVRHIFSKIGDECKRILTLRFEGYTFEEIAMKIGVKEVGTVRQKKRRCKQSFEKHFNQYESHDR